jgi:hypothetical protein
VLPDLILRIVAALYQGLDNLMPALGKERLGEP